jgi:non-heme chloroperoxidase
MSTGLIELSTGVTVNVTDVGSGPAIVLLHGVCMNQGFFAANIGPLSAEHRVVALDFRGHGDSPPAPDGHTLAEYARDVHALIGKLELDAPVLVGWSMGSLVIWEYLTQFADNPGITGAAILSQGPSDFTQPDWPNGIADIDELRELVEGLQDDFRGVFADFAPAMFKTAPPAEELEAMIDGICKVTPTTGTTIFVDQTLRDYRPQIPSITTPHLLVWGEDEQVGKLAAAEWLLAQLPSAELHVFDESGHCPMLEEPARFNALLTDWVARLHA